LLLEDVADCRIIRGITLASVLVVVPIAQPWRFCYTL
jgi:hypothetical protein